MRRTKEIGKTWKARGKIPLLVVAYSGKTYGGHRTGRHRGDHRSYDGRHNHHLLDGRKSNS